MTTIHDVEVFLRDFKIKSEVFGLVFWDTRQKNTQALFDLELTWAKRLDIVKLITAKEYSEGPVDDSLFGIAGLWVFGKKYKDQDIYIKISMGNKDDCAICISFHRAEHPMKYPLKSIL
ncbi:hypothetical protein [Daejeonella sp.]|uniref:hypothetical protein n=1 Tax=Daejeonella sp. TaxID=2805397 RepID=UPI0030BB15FB